MRLSFRAHTVAALVTFGYTSTIWAQTPPVLTFPPSAVVQVISQNNDPNTASSYLTVQVTNAAAGYSVGNGNYLGWCVDDPDSNIFEVALPRPMISSYDPQASALYPAVPWGKVNYILNHKQGTFQDVQQAIWMVIFPSNPGHFPVTAAVTSMVAGANSNPNFVSGSLQQVAVIVQLDGPSGPGTLQDYIMEVTAPFTQNQNPPPTITCGSINSTTGIVGSSYSAQISASGGVSPFTFSLASGSLPSNLNLNTSTGAITGIPTVAGSFPITIKIADSSSPQQSATTSTCTVAVVAPPPTITCGTVSTTSGTQNQPFSAQLSVTGGLSPFTFTLASGLLPANLSLNQSTGVISGTPVISGSFPITVKITDSSAPAQSATSSTCTISIAPPQVQPPSISCGTVNSTAGQQNSPYSAQLSASGGKSPYTYSLASGALPANLTLNGSTGKISGTPIVAGSFPITVKIVDSSSPALSATSTTCTIAIAATNTCGNFTTFTQGGWGAAPHGNNPGALLKQYFSAVFPGGSVSIGSGGKVLTFNSALAIQNFLPAGGTPGTLTGSATDPASSSAGVFAGQLLAATLSYNFSNAGITRFGLATLKVKSGALAGYTVAQVLTLANEVIAGNYSHMPAGLTVSGLSDVLNAINNNYDNGTQDNGYLH